MTYGDFPFSVALGTFLLLPALGTAEEFDAQAFEDAVNKVLADSPGVTFSIDERAAAYLSMLSVFSQAETEWTAEAIRTAPDFGFVVYDTEGSAWDILSGDVPYQTLGSGIDIIGYHLPQGYTVNTVGKPRYVDAVIEIAQERQVGAPSNDIEKAVQIVKSAGDYIMQELCTSAGRPTEIALNLTAGFRLVFDVETGSKFTWDLEVVCNR